MAGLGSGKTTLVQGAAEKWGAKQRALSPTFILAQTIKGRVPLHHIDFYRLTKKEILDFGIQDYLSGTGLIEPGLVFIEWADRFKEIWPNERLEIHMRLSRHPKERKILIRGRGAHFCDVLHKLRKTK